MVGKGVGRLVRGLLLLGLLTGASVAQASLGGWLYAQNRSLEAWRAGLTQHTVNINGVRWVYYARHLERPACEVLLHGFTADAATWFRFARNLDGERCLIVPDLPGFGRSAYDPTWNFSVPAQTLRLHDFLRGIRAQGPFHLVGSSMGGHIALAYTLQFPQDVASLALVDAAGVLSPQLSDNAHLIARTGHNAFDVHSRADFDAMLAMAMQDPPWVPDVVKDYLAAEFIARNARYQSIYKAIHDMDTYDTRLGDITTPTCIIWGERDRLLHPSMAEVFRRRIAASQLETLPAIGHLPYLEAPARTAELYLRFRESVPTR